MSLVRQSVISLAAVAVAVALWIAYVPAATPWLDRVGILDALGIDPAEAQQTAAGGPPGGRGPAQVVTESVTMALLANRVSAIGDGRALRSVTVRPESGGRIVEVGIAPGQFVEEGALIARLDDVAEQIAVERARLTLANAREELDRLSQLEETGAVTGVRYREAQLAAAAAELELREAEFELEQKTIRAPIGGWAGLVDLQVGDRVTAQDSIATITDRTDILVDFRVPERVIGMLEPGMAFAARPLALPDTVLTGGIDAVDNRVDRTSRTLGVRGRLDNEGDRLRGGMAFEVTMEFAGRELPSVSPLAVQWSDAGSFVWAVRDGRAVQVPARIVQRGANAVLVEAELSPGDEVVVEGVQSLRPGAEVALAGRSVRLAGGSRQRG